MKKILAILLVAVMLLMLASCGKNNKPDGKEETPKTGEETNDPEKKEPSKEDIEGEIIPGTPNDAQKKQAEAEEAKQAEQAQKEAEEQQKEAEEQEKETEKKEEGGKVPSGSVELPIVRP